MAEGDRDRRKVEEVKEAEAKVIYAVRSAYVNSRPGRVSGEES